MCLTSDLTEFVSHRQVTHCQRGISDLLDVFVSKGLVDLLVPVCLYWRSDLRIFDWLFVGKRVPGKRVPLPEFFLDMVILFFLRILLGGLEDDEVSETRAVSFSKGVILIFGALIMGFYSGTTLKFGMVTVGWVDAFVVKKGKGSEGRKSDFVTV